MILAAGFSSRFVPICFDKPKALIIIEGETLIERQIRQLKETGITNIYIVTGAHHAQFEYLRKAQNVELIYNNDYARKNNFASFFAARHVLGNTLISSADLFFPENIFVSDIAYPCYASVFMHGKTSQRCLTLDKNDKIISTTYGGHDTWITFGGHAYLNQKISTKLLQYIKLEYDNPEYKDKYWVEFQDEHLNECPMYIKRCDKDSIIEFNTLEAIKNYNSQFVASDQSATMKLICDKLSCEESELEDFNPIMHNNEAIGCSFFASRQKYMYLCSTKSVEICND